MQILASLLLASALMHGGDDGGGPVGGGGTDPDTGIAGQGTGSTGVQPQTSPGKVTRDEFSQVQRGMARAKAERIFGAGHGCEYLRVRVGAVTYTGRQYRSTITDTINFSRVTIRYAERDGVTRVVGRQWNTLRVC